MTDFEYLEFWKHISFPGLVLSNINYHNMYSSYVFNSNFVCVCVFACVCVRVFVVCVCVFLFQISLVSENI